MTTATRKSDEPVDQAIRFVLSKAQRDGVYAPPEEVEVLVRGIMSGASTSVPDRAKFVLEWLVDYGFRRL
jgi:hypothetical protein